MSLTSLSFIALILAFFGLKFTRIDGRLNFVFNYFWSAGSALLGINILLLGMTILGVVLFPISTPFFIVLSPVISVISWNCIRICFRKPLVKRLYAFFIGHSIYFILLLYCIYGFFTLKPSYPGEDMFMSGLGYLIGVIISFFAIILGLITFLLPYKNIKH